MRFTRVLCFTLSALYLTTQAGLGRATDMKDRIKRIKESIVRILVDGQPAGSGFVVSKNGLIATCFHVVQKNEPAANNQTRITYATNIQVEFSNGTKLSGTVHSSCENQGFADALSKDFCIPSQSFRSEPTPHWHILRCSRGGSNLFGWFPFGN